MTGRDRATTARVCAGRGRAARAYALVAALALVLVGAQVPKAAAAEVDAGVPEAAATDAEGATSMNYPLEIDIRAAKDGENVVSAVVPSSVSIVIRTSIVDGHLMGFIGGAAQVENNRHSYAPISLSVTSVEDAPVASRRFLQYVDMTLHGHHDYDVVEGQGQSAPLFDSIAPGTSATLEASVKQSDPSVMIPTGSYLVRTTLLVTPQEVK